MATEWQTVALALCSILAAEIVRLRLEVQELRGSTYAESSGWNWNLATVAHFALFATVMWSGLVFVKRELDIAAGSRFEEDAEQESIEIGVNEDQAKRAFNHSLKFTLKEYAFYRMDYLLSNWASAKPLALLVATYVLIFLGAVLYYTVGSSDLTFSEAFWVSWTFVADPGTHAEEQSFAARAVALLLTMGGMLIFALMIGIIADGVSDLLDDLKKGKSRVIESGHTLILGWSDKVIPTIREIALANESEGGGTIVILAEKPKEKMETDLSGALAPEALLGTEVVCRDGSPLIMTDLLKVSAQTAKAVIVLSDPTVDPDESDARAVRIVMSLTGIHIKSHIVVEMCDVDNRELVLLVGKGKVETVVAHDVIGRLMIQCARQPGLAQILEQLLGFEGDEFYLKEWQSLVGKTFLDACFSFENAVPIGIKPADPERAAEQLRKIGRIIPDSLQRTSSKELVKEIPQQIQVQVRSTHGGPPWSESDDESDSNSDFSPYSSPNAHLKSGMHFRARSGSLVSLLGNGPRQVLLNPPDEYEIQPGDEVLVIAQDDDTYEACASDAVDEFALRARESVRAQQSRIILRKPEKLLFCGWRRDMDDMISSLDRLVARGSELHLMCTIPVKTRLKKFRDANKLDLGSLENLHIVHSEGNPVLRRHLEGMKLEEFSSILILADEAFETNMQTADSRSLASLLLIRDIIQKRMQGRIQLPSSHSANTVEDGDFDVDCSELKPPPLKQSPTRLGLQVSECSKSPQQLDRADSGFQKDEASTTIISEILDSRTKSLISVAQVSDYVMSNEIVAQAMAMVAEDRAINHVLSELLSAQGADFQVMSCFEYCEFGEELDFWTIMARARSRCEIAIGYKPVEDQITVINPRNKSAQRIWRKGDMVVVIKSFLQF